MLKNLFFAISVFVLLGWAGTIYSQPEIPGAEEEDSWVTYGTVSDISDTSIVIKEFDFETEQEKLVSYVIDAGTEMKNFSQISEVKPGDDVVIEFVQKADVKQAIAITKEEVVAEPETPGETIDNDSDGGVLSE